MSEIFKMPDDWRKPEQFTMGGNPPPSAASAGGKPELKFPLIVHHRVIITKDRLDEESLKAAIAPFNVVEPLKATMSSSSNHYIAYAFAALLLSREELYRLDAILRQVPGVRMVL